MPGRLIMEQQHTIGSQDLKKDGSHAPQGGETSQKQDIVQKPGQNGSISNGVSMGNDTPVRSAAPADMTGLHTPPELDQSWRASDANKSMGVLIERLAQQCFGDLNATLTKMAEVPESETQANGVVPHTTDKSETSLVRKRTLMDFAKDQRDRFIKTLVLSDWARNADDMARLVDIKLWQETQTSAQFNAIRFMGTIKDNMAGAKMPNPNIEGALELLATGKNSRIPDLGYLPAKRLTAKQLLRTLQDMNVALATRLNLHDELPFHFNDFTIANGRATFRVPQEFEVDFSVADEDPSTPFYFIDIRFLFNPTPSLSDEGLRGALEGRANIALANDGPKGCYELMHNFVLTHKINILRDQTITLLREKWFDCLSIEMKKRVLIVQYWSGMPGPKSWLEVGVCTGKQKSKRTQNPTPQIAVRWFRKGKETVKDEDSIRIDWHDISAESVLAVTTAKHVSWTLSTVKERLHTLSGAASKLEAALTTSESTPEDCSLALSLPGLRTPVTVRVSGITGKWSISPPTPFTARAERSLNADPSVDPALSLTQLLCGMVQERVAKAADLAGWKPVPRQALAPLSTAAVTTLFGPGVVARSIYRCSTGWGDSWALIATFGMYGEQWWATRLERNRNQANNADQNMKTIVEARPIPTKVFDSGSVSRAQLLRVEKLVAAEVAMATVTQELRDQEIRYKVETTESLAGQSTAVDSEKSPVATTAVIFEATLLVKSAPKSMQANVIRITHTGVSVAEATEGELAEMRHSIRLTVKPGSLTHLQAYLAVQSRSADIAMNNSGALALQLRTPFGEPYLQHVKSRLDACIRLDQYLALLSMYKHEVLSLSLRKFSFVYSESPRLTATFKFTDDGGVPAKLRLEPLDSNPQQRVRVHIEQIFKSRAGKDVVNAFHTLVRILAVTLPAYHAFDKIERLRPLGGVVIHIQNPMAFIIEYRAPMPVCKVVLHFRNNDKQFKWNVATPLLDNDGKGIPDPMRFAFLELCQSKGEGWFGDGRRSLVVDPAAVGGVLGKIDGILRSTSDAAGGGQNVKGEQAAVDSKAPESVKQEISSSQQRQQPAPSIFGKDAKSAAPSQKSNNPQQNQAARNQANAKFKKEIIELD